MGYSSRRGQRSSRRRPAKTTRRKRSYRKRSRKTGRTRRGRVGVGRRALLNVTSRKKRNTMLSWTNTTGSGALGAVIQSPLVVAGSTSGATLAWVEFVPTAMDLTDTGSNLNSTSAQAVRTSTNCFMRGFAENIRIETSSPNPWFHRRFCFTSKALDIINLSTKDTPGTDRSIVASGSIETSNGWQRLAANMALDTQMSDTYLRHRNLIFKGSQGVDWDDFITAPLDTSRIDVKYDKTWIYRSGNQQGILKETKIWHPMNKSLVYDDDENGAGENTSAYSVSDKRGMGDYHIVDLFSQGSSGGTSDLIKVRYTSTLYWHER
uniref:Capsid protein n=1 Tax=Giant panda feces-associated gemycircularvirus TaxID=2864014 RepID=A0A8K1HJP8_9VIRU|nr:capsid protein [Giant panda feces-associated gemycircularvirus]